MFYFYLAITLFISAIFIASFYFDYIILFPKKLTHEKTLETETSKNLFEKDDFDKIPSENIIIKSPYGYNLYALFIPYPNSKKSIIICHGIRYTLWGSVKYMNIFRKLGFNVLIYDHRNHGKSEGKNTTFGYYEKYDLKACMDWVFSKVGNDSILGLHGESMGASTVLEASILDNRIAFIIEDCGYSDLMELLKHRLKVEYHLPSFPFINIASLFSKLYANFYFKDVSPKNTIKTITTPILFIHGELDDYVPTHMCHDLYKNKPGYKKIYIAKEAGHARSYYVNPEKYKDVVYEFLKEINIINNESLNQ